MTRQTARKRVNNMAASERKNIQVPLRDATPVRNILQRSRKPVEMWTRTNVNDVQ